LLPRPDGRFGKLGDFANGVPSFDEVIQPYQAFLVRLALAVADAWPSSATT